MVGGKTKKAIFARGTHWCVPNRCKQLIPIERKIVERKESLQAVPFDRPLALVRLFARGARWTSSTSIRSVPLDPR